MGFDNLPFPRGTVLDAGTNEFESLVGAVYNVEDTQHFGGQMKLRIVRNHSGSAMTLNHAAVYYGTAEGDLGRYVVGYPTLTVAKAGAMCRVVDDAYSGESAGANDLFYVVEEGPVDIRVKATTTFVKAQYEPCWVGKNGYLLEANTNLTDSHCIIGRVMKAHSTAVTASQVYNATIYAFPEPTLLTPTTGIQ